MERFFKIQFKGADADGLSAIEPEIYKERYISVLFLYLSNKCRIIQLSSLRFIRHMEDILDLDETEKYNLRRKNIVLTTNDNDDNINQKGMFNL